MKHYAVYICGYPGGRMRDEAATGCPQYELHTPTPAGYLQWFDWAEEMSKTHSSTQCPGCGKWFIWQPNTDARELAAGDSDDEGTAH